MSCDQPRFQAQSAFAKYFEITTKENTRKIPTLGGGDILGESIDQIELQIQEITSICKKNIL